MAERFFGESSHTMAGSIADMKSNKVGLGVAWNDGDCGKGRECENTADNPM